MPFQLQPRYPRVNSIETLHYSFLEYLPILLLFVRIE